jgi:sugar phosphate isomerase/epimerase
MLQRLGIGALAYDWRDKDVPTFDEELAELRAHRIEMTAFWLSGGYPEHETSAWENPRQRAGLEFFKRNNLNIEAWASYRGEGTEELTDEEQRYDAAARRVGVLADLVNGLGCRLGLYNHGGWGGEPATMTAVARRLEARNVGIVYNFHHGHEHLDDMPGAFEAMVPYLMCVNLNGMTRGGPKILPVGSGEEDRRILRMIRDSGYPGPIGILGHRADVDAEVSLTENLEGLRKVLPAL